MNPEDPIPTAICGSIARRGQTVFICVKDRDHPNSLYPAGSTQARHWMVNINRVDAETGAVEPAPPIA